MEDITLKPKNKFESKKPQLKIITTTNTSTIKRVSTGYIKKTVKCEDLQEIIGEEK